MVNIKALYVAGRTTIPKKKYVVSKPTPQNFSIPEQILYYVAKNPTPSKVYRKLINSCKYFYFKNRITLLSTLRHDDYSKWTASVFILEFKKIDLSKQIPKIWLRDKLEIRSQSNANIASFLASKIYRSDISELYLDNQTLTYEELQMLSLSKKVIVLNLQSVVICKPQNIFISFEELFENFPNLVYCNLENVELSYSVESVQKALKNFHNLEVFKMNEISEAFDFQTFSKFMEANPTVHYVLKFVKNLSEPYQKQLKEYAKGLLPSCTRKVPFIIFRGVPL